MNRMPTRQFRTLVLFLLVCIGNSTLVSAQSGQPRVGRVEFPNSGAAEAQESFLLGLALLHSFEYPEAREAFRAAQELDPAFVMAYWGEAMAWNYPLWYEQNTAAAREILARLAPTPAARATLAPTDRERAWLAAVEVLYGEGDKQSRDDAYQRAMATIRLEYPDDPEAGAFHALSILGTAHEGRDHPTYMRAAAIAGDVFRDHPEHPGAAHYIIHSFDDPEHAPLGLAAARAYSEIAPDADHAQHMTTHIFLALGMWDDVVRANENAVSVVDRDRAARGQGPSYCGHYNEWLLYGYLMEGRPEEALVLLDGCHESAVARGGGAASSFSEMRARYLIDSEDWRGPAMSMAADYVDRAGPPLRDAWLRGYVAARNNDAEGARAALVEFRNLRPAAEREMRDEGLTDATYQHRPGVLELQLEGLTLIAEGLTAEGLARVESAAAVEAQLPFTYGPPAIDKPSHELLGELLLKTGQTEEARMAFETSVSRTPGRVPAVQGLQSATAALQAETGAGSPRR
jgi:tetratricopeptide (TPR) repeat protein